MDMAKPIIRFKGYQDDWEQRKLGEIITEYKETVDSECTLPILTSSKTEGVILQEEHFGRKQQHDITGYNILPRNYCTYRNRSDGVDFTFNINKCCDKGIISKFYPVFSGKNSDVFFLSLVLNNSDEVVREIAYTCTGTGQKVLSFLDLQKMKVRVPSYDEQKEIAAYFENLDYLITLHQRKCDETKRLKKYMLQKMFPQNGEKVPEIRFSGFTDDWEQRKLGDEAIEMLAGGDIDKSRVVENGKYPIYANALTNDGIVGYYDDYYRVKAPAVTVTGRGDVGHAQARTVDFTPVVRLLAIRSEHDAYFLENAINNHGVIVESTGVPQLTVPQLGNYMIQFPRTIKEETKIGDYFRNLDHLITLHQRELENLQNIKKFMLGKMFV